MVIRNILISEPDRRTSRDHLGFLYAPWFPLHTRFLWENSWMLCCHWPACVSLESYWRWQRWQLVEMVVVGRGGSTWTVCPEGTYPMQHTLRHSEPHSSPATSTTHPAHIRTRNLKQLTVDDRPATGCWWGGGGVGGARCEVVHLFGSLASTVWRSCD